MFDVVLAGFVVALTVPLVREVALVDGGRLVAVATVNGAVHAGVLVLRRPFPLVTAGVVGATALVHVGLGLPVPFLGPAALVVVFTVATRRVRRVSLAVLGVGVALLTGGMLAIDATLPWDSLVLYVVLLSASWLLGDMVRRRQEEARLHAQRARQLEAAREELAHHAVMQERLRIARELHDVVAHSMTGIAVHAGTARLALDADTELARRALEVVEGTVRDTLGELRHLLGVLRAPENDRSLELAPVPGLGAINELVAHAVDAGLTAEVSIEGDPPQPLPAAMELAVYRIVQEAVTNVVKHAAASRTVVVLRYLPDAVEVQVVDDGHGRQPAGRGGHGLLGMRERVVMFDGELAAGPFEDNGAGGWRVRARLPYPGAGR